MTVPPRSSTAFSTEPLRGSFFRWIPDLLPLSLQSSGKGGEGGVAA